MVYSETVKYSYYIVDSKNIFLVTISSYFKYTLTGGKIQVIHRNLTTYRTISVFNIYSKRELQNTNRKVKVGLCCNNVV